LDAKVLAQKPIATFELSHQGYSAFRINEPLKASVKVRGPRNFLAGQFGHVSINSGHCDAVEHALVFQNIAVHSRISPDRYAFKLSHIRYLQYFT
jgi:hypothetical protein